MLLNSEMYTLTVIIDGKIIGIKFSSMDRELDPVGIEEKYIVYGIIPACFDAMFKLAEGKSFEAELSMPTKTWKLLNCKIEDYESVGAPSVAILAVGMVED